MKKLLRNKWTWIAVGALVVLTLVVLGLVGTFSSLQAYREMKSAKDLMFSAMDSLRKRNVEAAASEFEQARAKSEKAASELNSHKISVGFLKLVPFAGAQVRALESFTRIGGDLSQAGINLAGSLRGAPGMDAASSEQMTMGAMVDTLARLSNDMDPVLEELEEARRESDAIKTRWLIGRAKNLKKELDEKLDSAISDLAKAQKLMAVVPDILGAAGQPPKTYMVLQQDCYELRASGGLMSTYGILTCTHDSMELTDYQRAGGLPELDASEVPPLPALGGWLASYGIAPTLKFSDVGWWPDFPLTAELVGKIWAKSGKPPVDGYIAVDPVAIGYVLEELGPLKVTEFGETVTAENLSPLILKYKEARKANNFLKALSTLFFQKIITADPGEWISLAKALGRALDERHMIVYFNDPRVEEVFSELGWSGTMDLSKNDYVMAVDSNVGGNEQRGYKANMFIKPKMSVDLIRQKDSTLRHHVTYTLDNTSGNSEIPLRYKSYLRLFVPDDAAVKGTVALAATGLVEEGVENGKRVFGRLVDVPIGESVTVEFDYVTGDYGSLVIQKQPGIPELNVSLVYIEGGSIRKSEELPVANTVEVELKK